MSRGYKSWNMGNHGNTNGVSGRQDLPGQSHYGGQNHYSGRQSHYSGGQSNVQGYSGESESKRIRNVEFNRTRDAKLAWHGYKSADQLILAIMSRATNRKICGSKFEVLRRLIDSNPQYLYQIPFIENLAKQPIKQVEKYLVPQEEGTVQMTRLEIAQCLANGFFCTFDDETYKNYGFQNMNFDGLYSDDGRDRSSAKLEKLKCLMEYFNQVEAKINMKHNLDGKITFQRVCVKKMPDWEGSQLPLCDFQCNQSDSIFDCPSNMAAVDFANKRIGGGVINNGSVQEEIKFITCPDLIAARLLCPELEDNEAVIIEGASPYSKHAGYGRGFQYAGPADQFANRSQVVLAIDALDFSRGAPHMQYTKEAINRELVKAYAGFCNSPLEKIATGNWGGGAFKGDPTLKMLIQWLAASVAQKKLHYYCFNDQNLLQEYESIQKDVNKLKIRTINDLYVYTLCRFNEPYRNSVQQRKVRRMTMSPPVQQHHSQFSQTAGKQTVTPLTNPSAAYGSVPPTNNDESFVVIDEEAQEAFKLEFKGKPNGSGAGDREKSLQMIGFEGVENAVKSDKSPEFLNIPSTLEAQVVSYMEVDQHSLGSTETAAISTDLLWKQPEQKQVPANYKNNSDQVANTFRQ
ncbi:uncharacterized protein LOC132192657 isoform X2 [Neocloeon triangulifer]|uniref:uncharacterized protein LOC132192657 isoform X2 n=1 Tax=Neocloeon triangulifer TaxID=2078957 RepID=UPI00286F7BB8|nr:uncharacterized protein LOC132192657 isoform X2 [Neocloeon triangulifer]